MGRGIRVERTMGGTYRFILRAARAASRRARSFLDSGVIVQKRVDQVMRQPTGKRSSHI